MVSPQYKFLYTFDRSIFKRNWGRINRGPLSKAGALGRMVWRGLIRIDRSKKQTPSKPGKPPKSRAPGHPFRRIFYDVNTFETSLVIGHVGFGATQTAMEKQEFGQRTRIREFRVPSNRRRLKDPKERARVRKLYQTGRLKSQRLPVRFRSVQMPKRPHADPTLQRMKNRLPALWKDSVNTGTVRN